MITAIRNPLPSDTYRAPVKWHETALTVKASDTRRMPTAPVGATRTGYLVSREGVDPMRAAIERMMARDKAAGKPLRTYREYRAIQLGRLARKPMRGLTYQGRARNSD